MSWFARLTEIANLNTNVPIPNEDGASIKVTVHRPANEKVRVLGAGSYEYLKLDFNTSNTATVVKYSDITRAFTFGGGEGKPRTVEVMSGTNPDTGNPGFSFIEDGETPRWEDSGGGDNSFWTIKALLSDSSSDKGGGFSRGVVRDGSGNIIVDWDANYVLNAAGDGWVLRTDANNNPSIAESGSNGKMYDHSDVNGNHVDLPASTTWEFISGFVAPEQVEANSTGLVFEAPEGFNVDRFDFSGIEVPFTFDAGTSSGTFDPPSLGNVPNFAPFGETTITIYDDTAGTFAATKVDWVPPAPLEYSKFFADPDTTTVGNAYYQWQDPPVATNQAVFDTTYYTISDGVNDDGDPTGNDGVLKINPDAPAQFAVSEYVIDENGMQEFERNSSPSGLSLPSVTISTPAQAVNAGSTVQLSATVTGADTILWSTSGSGTFTDATIEDAEFIAGDGGEIETLTLSATNGDGTVTATVDITVNAASSGSTLNLTVEGIGSSTEQVALHRRSNNSLAYLGSMSFVNDVGSVSLSSDSAGTEIYGVWFGGNPPVTGTGLYGVTE